MLVLSLFDYTGIMVRPWAEAGYECICVDIQHPAEGRFEEVGKGNISYVKLDLSFKSPDWEILEELSDVVMLFGFPVCTDLSISGAKHWEGKREINPAFQHIATRPASMIEDLGKKLKCKYMIENPRSMLSKLWRKEDHVFEPYEYGGYLPGNDKHPTYPDVIPGRDAYNKTTCIWSGGGFIMPIKSPVEPQFALYRRGNGEILKVSTIVARTGGKSLKTKNIRSATPRGFAKAVFIANGQEQ